MARGALAIGVLVLAGMNAGPALAAPPAPDVTITVVDNPEQLNEHVNTLTLPPAQSAAAPVKESGAAGAKEDRPQKRAPVAQPVEPAARKSANPEHRGTAATGTGAGRSAHPAQSSAPRTGQAPKESHPPETPDGDRQGVQRDTDDGTLGNPSDAEQPNAEQQPDTDETGPQDSSQSAQPDTDDQPPPKPPLRAGVAQ
jgi:hypothetical protein